MRLKTFFERLPREGWENLRPELRRCISHTMQCPVTSVCRPTTSYIDWKYAAERGGLELWLARVIAHAADDNWALTAHHEANIAELRLRLLQHVGLA